MRKVLLATTALGMGAGVAFAQDAMMEKPVLAIGGNAEMGVAGSKDDDARFHTDMDIEFRASGVMDTGVVWKAAIDLDEVRNEKDGVADHATANDDEAGGVTLTISQPEGFGTLEMGDTGGAIAWAVSDAKGAGPGSIGDNHEHDGMSGNDGLDGAHDDQVLRWNRAIGSGFSVAASIEIDDDKDGEPDTKGIDDPILGLGGTYSMAMGVGTLGLGLGFQTGSDERKIAGFGEGAADLWDGAMDLTAVGGSVSLDFGNGGDGIKLVADAGVMEGEGTSTSGTSRVVTQTADMEAMHMGLGLGYTVGAISLGVNVGTKTTEYTHDNVLTGTNAATGRTVHEQTVSGIGFSAAYALGGGAELQFGVGSDETENDWTVGDGDNAASGGDTARGGRDGSSDKNSWSLGVKFKF